MTLPAVIYDLSTKRVLRHIRRWRPEYPLEANQGAFVGEYGDPSVPQEVDNALNPTALIDLPLPDGLAAAKEAAKHCIDMMAGALRSKLLSAGEYQAEEYTAKFQEAADYLAVVAAGGTPNAADYPWLDEEAADLGEALSITAQRVSDRRQAVDASLRAIARQRRLAKAAVDQATTEAEVGTIKNSIPWPTI